MTTPPVCDYEGSDYQTSFWDRGGRQYEDLAEAAALKRLLPAAGHLMLELGAGAGRNTLRYQGFDRIVLLDYSLSQLEQARTRLGDSARFIYVAADIYKLPFRDAKFDAATMIRTLHHMAQAPAALKQVRRVLQPGSIFILEFANKLNLKSILRYWLGKQSWSPFTPEPVEFVSLNFDFHPKEVKKWLAELGFEIQNMLSVSFFRLGLLKRIIPAKILASLDNILQPSGKLFQLTPSVFVRAQLKNWQSLNSSSPDSLEIVDLFRCPECESHPLQDQVDFLVCPACGKKWSHCAGIYDFRAPIE